MPIIIAVKFGKLVAMKAGVIDLDRLIAGEPHHQRGHRDAMVHVRRDQSAAGCTAAAAHDQIVAI